MPVLFKKVKKEAAIQAPPQAAAPPVQSVPAPTQPPAVVAVPEGEPPKGWMMRGEQAKAAFDAAPDPGDFTSFRFGLKEGNGTKITFLDGSINQNTGFFNTLMIWEHQVEYAGSWFNFFPCTWKNEVPDTLKEPCPLCANENKAYIVAYFTIIDHGVSKDSKGKQYQNETRLFAAKKKTISTLLRLAATRAGGDLSGARFGVYRDGPKDARVGNSFDFLKKFPVSAILEKYKSSVIDYEEVVPWKTRNELIGMGVVGAPVGSEPGAVTGEDIDVEEDL